MAQRVLVEATVLVYYEWETGKDRKIICNCCSLRGAGCTADSNRERILRGKKKKNKLVSRKCGDGRSRS